MIHLLAVGDCERDVLHAVAQLEHLLPRQVRVAAQPRLRARLRDLGQLPQEARHDGVEPRAREQADHLSALLHHLPGMRQW